MASRNRLDGTVCEDIALKALFINNGIPQDPLALCSVKIYKCSVSEANLVTEIIFPAPTESDYDLSNEFIYDNMIQRCDNQVADEGQCGTDLEPSFTPGCFILNLNLCPDLFEPGVYFDVWNFVGSECDPCATDVTDVTAVELCDDETQLQSQCNKFFVNDRGWFVDDGLKNFRLGFEPLDKRVQQPEKRYIEVGLTPLPLYDYDSSFAALIPSLSATITFLTACNEVLVDAEPMTIGLRQGSFRSNPYVVKYLLDSTKFLKGTYRYRVDVQLPDGQTRSSPLFSLAIR